MYHQIGLSMLQPPNSEQREQSENLNERKKRYEQLLSMSSKGQMLKQLVSVSELLLWVCLKQQMILSILASRKNHRSRLLSGRVSMTLILTHSLKHELQERNIALSRRELLKALSASMNNSQQDS